jgi:hypothetical protein
MNFLYLSASYFKRKKIVLKLAIHSKLGQSCQVKVRMDFCCFFFQEKIIPSLKTNAQFMRLLIEFINMCQLAQRVIYSELVSHSIR